MTKTPRVNDYDRDWRAGNTHDDEGRNVMGSALIEECTE